MVIKKIGITAGRTQLTVVRMEFEAGTVSSVSDETWPLQNGHRPLAYQRMYERMLNYLKEHGISHVIVKGSASAQKGLGLSHLEAAELRGVVLAAACASGATVKSTTKSMLSRVFGKRNTDDYLTDNKFWEERGLDDIRKGSRETALLILNEQGK